MGTIGKRALLILPALVALAAVGCGGSDGSSETVPNTPQGAAESAGFQGVHSGELEVAFEIDRYKKPNPEEINMRILGTFMGAGEGSLPQLDMAIESRGDLDGRTVEFLSGPLWKDDKVVVNFDGKVYEPDKATFEDLKSKLEAAQDEEGAGDAGACLDAAGDFEVTGVLRKLAFERTSETLDGKPTKVVGAELDVPAALEELARLSEDPACGAQLEAMGVPAAAQLEVLKQRLKHSVISSPVTVQVGKNGVLRYLKILTNIELGSKEELELELIVRLNRVNEVTELPETHGYAPFPALLKQFGLDAEDIEGADGGEITAAMLEALSDRLFGREGS